MIDSARSSQTRPVPLIAHVLFRFDVGGLENGVVNLINRIPEDRYRHVIVALSEYTEFRRRLSREIPVYALHKREGKDFALHGRLYRLFRKLKPDVVHTRNLNAVEAQLPAWAAGVRGRVHGEHGWDVHDLDGESRKYRLWRRAFRPFVQRYIPLSQHLARYLEQQVGISGARINCICNGVDVVKFHPSGAGREQLRHDGFFGENTLVFGTLGRMETVKDQLTMARAFVHLIQLRPELRSRLRLLMVGDGRLRDSIEQYLLEQGVGDLAWLPGQRDDTAELLRAMNVFVLPSLAEGISNTILEAMASGKPVVATDVGGNGELVEHGVTGMLVPKADPERMALALAAYLDQPDLGRKHGKNARMRAETRFSLDTMVEQYMQVYDSVLYPGRDGHSVQAVHRQ